MVFIQASDILSRKKNPASGLIFPLKCIYHQCRKVRVLYFRPEGGGGGDFVYHARFEPCTSGSMCKKLTDVYSKLRSVVNSSNL